MWATASMTARWEGSRGAVVKFVTARRARQWAVQPCLVIVTAREMMKAKCVLLNGWDAA